MTNPCCLGYKLFAELAGAVDAMVDDILETQTLAWLYLKQGHPERAAEIFGRLLSADRDNESAARGLASCRDLLRARGREAGMAQGKRIAVLQQMLARLTGTQVPDNAAKTSARATAIPERMNPREKKLRLLRSMLDRLNGSS